MTRGSRLASQSTMAFHMPAGLGETMVRLCGILLHLQHPRTGRSIRRNLSPRAVRFTTRHGEAGRLAVELRARRGRGGSSF